MEMRTIIEMIREFVGVSGGNGYELPNGQIHISDPQFEPEVERYLESEEGKRSPKISSRIDEILKLNRRLQAEELDDPEPLEDELLRLCHELLGIVGIEP